MVVEIINKMKKIFVLLVILFLILTLILIGASFYFSQDNLISLASTQTDFYLHFNFHQWHLPGIQALLYFNQHWPGELLEKLLTGQRTAFRYNLGPEIINYLDEMAILVKDGEPILIYKFKSNFANFPLILGRQKGSKIFYRFFHPQIVALALDQKIIDELILKPNSISFYPGFAQGFFRLNGLTLGRFNFYFRDQKIFLKGQINGLSFSSTLYEQIDYFFHLASQLPNENFLFAFLNQNNFPPLAIEKILKRKLAYYYPEEVERILPDQSKIIELVANPNYFEFQKEKLNGFEINNFKSSFNLSFFLDKNYIILSSKPELINEYFNDNFSQYCFDKGLEEIFYWQPVNLDIKNLIISGKTIKEGLLISGYLQLK